MADEFTSKVAEWLYKLSHGLALAAILGAFGFALDMHNRCDSTSSRLDSIEDALFGFRNSLDCNGSEGRYHYLCQRLAIIDMQQQQILEVLSK